MITNKKKSRGQAKKFTKTFYLKHELSPEVLDCPKNIIKHIDSQAQYQLDLYTIRMVQDFVVTTDSSGNLATVIGNLPSNSGNWANLALVFDEYRVLALKVDYKPSYFAASSSTVILAPIASVIDLDNNSALGSYLAASAYSSQKESPGMKSFSRLALMSAVENSNFISTASPSTSFWIKYWSNGNPASTNIGRFVISYYVQFRGKGV